MSKMYTREVEKKGKNIIGEKEYFFSLEYCYYICKVILLRIYILISQNALKILLTAFVK